MNILRYETELRKDADKAHALAQNSGQAVDYEEAAELYEKCGAFELARVCREAAEVAK